MKITVKEVIEETRRRRWMVRFFANRVPHRRFFHTEREANDHAEKLKEQVRQGMDPRAFAAIHALLPSVALSGRSLEAVLRAGLQAVASEAPPTTHLPQPVDVAKAAVPAVYVVKWTNGTFTFLLGGNARKLGSIVEAIESPFDAEVRRLPVELLDGWIYFDQKRRDSHFHLLRGRTNVKAKVLWDLSDTVDAPGTKPPGRAQAP